MKVNLCIISSKIFKSMWARCHTPPTKELIEMYFKIIKNAGSEVRNQKFKFNRNK